MVARIATGTSTAEKVPWIAPVNEKIDNSIETHYIATAVTDQWQLSSCIHIAEVAVYQLTKAYTAETSCIIELLLCESSSKATIH